MATASALRPLAALAALVFLLLVPAGAARSADRAVIETRVDLALEELFRTVPGTHDLAARSEGVLVMPNVTKGGFIVGGAYGEGALRTGVGETPGQTVGYYSVGAASIGFQAGIQKSAHALFFLTPDALARFRNSDGWQVGADAEVTLFDRGAKIGVDSTVTQRPIVAIVFGQDGLLVGASLEGAKYSRIDR